MEHVHTSCYSYACPLSFIKSSSSLLLSQCITLYTHVYLFPDSYTCTCSFSIDFDRVNRTLCQQDTSADVDDVLAYIDVFTSFSENVTFSIVFEPVGNYTFRYFITSPTYTLHTGQSSKDFTHVHVCI